jgi:hypothetical protein
VALVGATGCDTGDASEPDPRLAAMADRLAVATVDLTFPWNTSAPEDGGLQATAEATTPATGGTASIGNTGGTGVSLRSDCADDARTPGAWADTVVVTVLEFGTDTCAGWTYVAAEGTETWVRDEYLVGLAPPDEEGSTGEDPRTARFRDWVTRLVDGSGRLTLLARHVPGTPETEPTVAFLRGLAEEMEALALEVRAAADLEDAACALAQEQVASAAADLETLSRNVASFFEGPLADASAVEQSAEAYASAQNEAADAVNSCLPAGT